MCHFAACECSAKSRYRGTINWAGVRTVRHAPDRRTDDRPQRSGRRRAARRRSGLRGVHVGLRTPGPCLRTRVRARSGRSCSGSRPGRATELEPFDGDHFDAGLPQCSCWCRCCARRRRRRRARAPRRCCRHPTARARRRTRRCRWRSPGVVVDRRAPARWRRHAPGCCSISEILAVSPGRIVQTARRRRLRERGDQSRSTIVITVSRCM